MIIGCTGNYRKSEYLDIVQHIDTFLSKCNIRCIVSSDMLNSPQINTIAVTWWFVGERRGNRWPILAIGLIIYKRSEQ